MWIEETPQTQVAIGSITTDEEHREQLAPEIQLTLPHAARLAVKCTSRRNGGSVHASFITVNVD